MNALIKAFAQTPAAMGNRGTASIFATLPELFTPEFWEQMERFAQNPSLADTVLDEMDQLGSHGAAVNPMVANHMLSVMRTARTTLRNVALTKAGAVTCSV